MALNVLRTCFLTILHRLRAIAEKFETRRTVPISIFYLEKSKLRVLQNST